MRGMASGIVVVVLALGGGAFAFAGPGGFVFSAPPGWVDISRDAPKAQREKAPPAMQAIADGHAFYAADLDSGGDGFMENVNAVVQTDVRPPVVTLAVLDAMEAEARAQLVKQGIEYRATKKELVRLGGVTVGRMVADARIPAGPVRMLQYSIPGDRSHAVLTFSSTAESFDRYEPMFDAAALATRGAVEPKAGFAMNWGSVGRSAIIGGVAGGVAVLLVALLKRKKASSRTGTTQP